MRVTRKPHKLFQLFTVFLNCTSSVKILLKKDDQFSFVMSFIIFFMKLILLTVFRLFFHIIRYPLILKIFLEPENQGQSRWHFIRTNKYQTLAFVRTAFCRLSSLTFIRKRYETKNLLISQNKKSILMKNG